MSSEIVDVQTNSNEDNVLCIRPMQNVPTHVYAKTLKLRREFDQVLCRMFIDAVMFRFCFFSDTA